MPLPGHETSIGTDLPGGGVQALTGTAFIVGLTERGPTDEPVLATSIGSARRQLGGLTNYSSMDRWLERFFRRGGARVYFSRVVGSSAAAATVDLADDDSGDAVTVSAVNAGEWGNGITVDLDVSTASVLTVELGGAVIEKSPAVADKQALIEWSERSRWVRVTDAGGGALKAAAGAALTGGSDDRVNITTDNWEDALGRLSPDLGAGQVLAPGTATAAVHEALLAHAAENNRFALLDSVDDDAAGVLGEIVAAYATGHGKSGAMVVPAVEDGGRIPASILAAARIAYTDATAGPGQYAAGARFGDIGSGSVTVTYTEDERGEINEAGGQVIVGRPTGPRIFGFRTLAGSESPWVLAAHARLAMALRVELDEVMEQFVLRTVDGPKFFGEFEGALAGVLDRAWNRRELFGDTAEEAYSVQADEGLNPPSELAQHRLNASVAFRPGAGAERIYLSLTKASVADTL